MVGFNTMGHLISVLFKRALSKYPLAQFTAKANPEDLESLAALIQQGKIKVHIDRNYPCAELPEAIRYIEAMRTRGKVAVSW
jgi:NADPH:quinone reductase-like Zn-dependent oxidoreductase